METPEMEVQEQVSHSLMQIKMGYFNKINMPLFAQK